MDNIKNIFNSLTLLIKAISPSIYAFLETTLPYSTPMPIATITLSSAGTFFGLNGFPGFLLVYSLEGIGLIATSKLVESIIEFIRGRNTKTLIMIIVLTVVVIIYINILVDLNVKIHTEKIDANYSETLTLLCYLPLIAGILNGLTLVKTNYEKELAENKSIAEIHFQQARADKLELRRLKIQGPNTNTAETSPANKGREIREKMAGDYKEYVFELLDQYNGNLSLTEITALVNKNKRVEFIHENVKGTWFKYKKIWEERSRQ